MTILGKLSAGFRKLGQKVTDTLSKIGSKIHLSSQLKPNTDYGKMTAEMRLHAKLADASYRPPKQRPQDIEGYKLDSQFNDTYYCVYHKGKKVYLCFRGTSPTDARDLKSDLQIVRGGEIGDGRFKESLAVADRVRAKHKNKTLVTVGHSLGGRIAQVVAKLKSFVSKGYGFNPGCGLGCLAEAQENLLRKQKYARQYVTHKVLGDPISTTAGLVGKVYTYPTKGAKSHSMENFLS